MPDSKGSKHSSKLLDTGSEKNPEENGQKLNVLEIKQEKNEKNEKEATVTATASNKNNVSGSSGAGSTLDIPSSTASVTENKTSAIKRVEKHKIKLQTPLFAPFFKPNAKKKLNKPMGNVAQTQIKKEEADFNEINDIEIEDDEIAIDDNNNDPSDHEMLNTQEVNSMNEHFAEKNGQEWIDQIAKDAETLDSVKTCFKNLVENIPLSMDNKVKVDMLMTLAKETKNKMIAILNGKTTTNTQDKSVQVKPLLLTKKYRKTMPKGQGKSAPNDYEKLESMSFGYHPADTKFKTSYSAITKKNIKPNSNKKQIPTKKPARKPVVLTQDQITKVMNGLSPFEVTKYKLVYFEDIRKCRVAWAKTLLYQSVIKPYQLGNVDWVTDTKLEVCINEKVADQLTKHMDTINGISQDTDFNPLTSPIDTNRNKPANRMARMIIRMTEEHSDTFSELFLHPHKESTSEMEIDAARDASSSGVDLIPRTKAAPIAKYDTDDLTVMTYNVRGITGIREELVRYLNWKRPTILALQETNLTKKTNRWLIPGYTCIEAKSELTKGGTGLLIGIRDDSGLSISELDGSPQWMAAKIVGTFQHGGKFELLAINIHLPQTSVRRKKAKQEVSTYLTKEHSKDKDMPMLLLGDFNADIAQSDRLTRRMGINLRRVSISNSTGSRRHNGKMRRMVDHIYYRGFHEHPDAGR
ncbi:hypothetical protein BB558_007019, partial [Smittium angustum]